MNLFIVLFLANGIQYLCIWIQKTSLLTREVWKDFMVEVMIQLFLKCKDEYNLDWKAQEAKAY